MEEAPKQESNNNLEVIKESLRIIEKAIKELEDVMESCRHVTDWKGREEEFKKIVDELFQKKAELNDVLAFVPHDENVDTLKGEDTSFNPLDI